MERGGRRIPLTLTGHRTESAADTAYVLDVYRLGKMSTAGRQRLRARMREGEKTYCHNAIAPEHIGKAWRAATQLVELGLLSSRGSIMSVGFALVQRRGSVLHIHLLCAATSERAKERSGRAKLDPSPGSILLTQLEDLARRVGLASVELSAVPYVIGYYRARGFRHLFPGEAVERAAVAEAARTVTKHRFASNDELDTGYKIGEAAIDVAKTGVGGIEEAKRLVEQLAWTVPEREFRLEDGGRIVAYDERGRVDPKITDMVARRGEYSDLVEAFMRLKEAGMADKVPRSSGAPLWDRATGEIDVIADDTFHMAKRIGEGRRKTRRRGRGRGQTRGNTRRGARGSTRRRRQTRN
jgi:hypothetical protein